MLGYREAMIRDRFHLEQDGMPRLVEYFPLQTGIHAIRYKIDGDLIWYKALDIPDKEEFIEEIDERFAIASYGDPLLDDRTDPGGIGQK